MSEQDTPQSSPQPPATKPPAKSPEKEPAKRVRVVNRLAQTVRFTIDDGNGPTEVSLAGRVASEPVKETSITAYTHALIKNGHLALRGAE